MYVIFWMATVIIVNLIFGFICKNKRRIFRFNIIVDPIRICLTKRALRFFLFIVNVKVACHSTWVGGQPKSIFKREKKVMIFSLFNHN